MKPVLLFISTSLSPLGRADSLCQEEEKSFSRESHPEVIGSRGT